MADATDAAFSDVEDALSTYDTESDADEVDVPIDGYFRRSNHPRELFVQSDALRQSQDKAREARSEAATGSAQGSRAARQSQSAPTVPHWEDDSTPILDAGPVIKPPPDYAAATAYREEEERQKRAEQRRSLEEPDDEASALTNRADAFDSEHPLVRNGLVGDGSNRESQEGDVSRLRQEHISVSSSPDTDAEEGGEGSALMGRWAEKEEERGWPSQRNRRVWRLCCVICLVVVFVCVVISILLRARRTSKTIPSGLDSATPGSFELPPYAQVEALQQHRHISGCEFTRYKSVSIETNIIPTWPETGGATNPRNFSFVERLSQEPGGIRLSGTVRVISADDDQQNQVRFDVEVATTRGLTVDKINHEVPMHGQLEVKYPDLTMDQAQGCMDYSITVKIQKGTYMGNFFMNTSNFDIQLQDRDLFSRKYDPWADWWEPGSRIKNTTVLHAERGNITGQGWKSPRTEVNTAAGSITGTWPLRDALILTTQDGNINVGVEPRNLSYPDQNYPEIWQERNTRVAKFSATSEKGYIRNHIVRDDGAASVPDRDYVTYVSTVQGDVRGDYLLGSTTELRTRSGEMNARIVPVDLGLSNITLHTENSLGYSNIWVIYPVSPSSAKTSSSAPSSKTSKASAERLFRESLHSTHVTKTGWLTLILPSIWAGTAEFQTDSGRIYINEDAYQSLQNETTRVVAVKNGGNSTVDLQSITGDLYLDVEAD